MKKFFILATFKKHDKKMMTKDGVAVNITHPRINLSFTGNTSSLIIVSVVQADQGLYRCVANNSVNTIISYPGSLTVHCEYT